MANAPIAFTAHFAVYKATMDSGAGRRTCDNWVGYLADSKKRKVAWEDGTTTEYGGKTIPIGQGNNAFIFPGLGFGSILADAKEITDGMVLEASYALADYVSEKHGDSLSLYPPVDELRAVSLEVAARVILQAQKDGVSQRPSLTLEGARQVAKQKAWKAEYLPIVRAARRE